MDISQLKTVIHVAELGSLSRAAERLNLAQPALSRHVRMLEEELGARLFERHGRGMAITESGRAVLDHAATIMAELQAIRDSVSAVGQRLEGDVAVGATPTVAQILTLPLTRRMRRDHPDLGIRFSSAFSGHLLDWLQRGELEMVVAYDPQPTRSLKISPILREDLLLVAGANSGLSLEKAVPFANLSDTSLILPGPKHGLRAIVSDCANRAGIPLKTGIEVDSFSSMIELVQDGFGATILPLAPIHAQVAAGKLCAAPLSDPVPSRRLVLAHSSDRPLSAAARYAGGVIRELAAELVGDGVWIGEVLDDNRQSC